MGRAMAFRLTSAGRGSSQLLTQKPARDRLGRVTKCGETGFYLTVTAFDALPPRLLVTVMFTGLDLTLNFAV